MDPLTRKRKLDAASDDQQPPSPVAIPDPDPHSPKPKRPRLSLPTDPTDPNPAPASASASASAPAPPPRSTPSRKSTPRPKPQPRTLTPACPVHYSLHRRTSLPGTLLSPLAESPISPATVTSPPPFLPPITRETLRELDLEAILRNPQLRHDLLFDPGLQFRPTSGRRKLLTSERYWAAVERELKNGCTCFDDVCSCGAASPSASSGTGKRTRPPTPPPWSNTYDAYLASAADPRLKDPALTRNKSRIGPMLRELVAVLASVIVPPPLATAPPACADAHALLSHLDPELIAQELRRGLFDPTGLFALIGATLKRHCAPMRDRLVDTMIRTAEGADADAESLTVRAVRTIRTCFEVLEFMKLDIANHQLQHLRPFLAASTPDFELRVFAQQCRRGSLPRISPRITQAWLQREWSSKCTSPFPGGLTFTTAPFPRRARIQATLIHAVTGLAFSPVPVSERPETLYLDSARVSLLEKDAADLTALYMLLMLWRQLVYWGGATRRQRLDDWEVDRVKREIWEVGPRRIGSCFADGEPPEAQQRWKQAMESVALQIAMRAEEARTCAPAGPISTRTVPSQEALELMRGWIASHLRRDSALATRLRTLLQHEVTTAVIRLTFPSGDVPRIPETGGLESPGSGTAGLEPLQPEIRHLAQRLAKLVHVNMRVYWSLYDARGFLVDEEAPAPRP